MTTMSRLRSYNGPAVLSYGFRPFFLLGAIYAGLSVLLWLPAYSGAVRLDTAFLPRDWHIHEMLYGYLPAVVTGFMLTAIPNWTGRLPVRGGPLLALTLIWIAGRLAIFASGWIGWALAAAIDCSFLAAIAFAAAREIAAGKNWHNLKVVLALLVLLAGNITFHLEARFNGSADYGVRLGLGAAIMLIILIGGRIVPSFTRNWLTRRNPGRLPASLGKYDVVSTAASGAALLAWIAAPALPVTGAALIVAGLLQSVRLARWAGDRTVGDRLVLILHLSYAFIPIGFVLSGLSVFVAISSSAGIHAWGAGAVGSMTMAVMSRASLGHTGRALKATPATQAIYLLVLTSASLRIIAAIWPEVSIGLVLVAGVCWSGAFLAFAAFYWRTLTGPRLSS